MNVYENAAYATHTILNTINPYPVPVEQQPCFNRSEQLFTYTYSSGYHVISEAEYGKPATSTPNKPMHDSISNTPIYQKPNVTTLTTSTTPSFTATSISKNTTTPSTAP
ncbi:hypothetical protein K469DRAFT_164723 [Zopfia rhizophila CBS 207.26]|uniref:Uncharacterized protein n=1 Tax=Zopfia rhizophila CBS 207.26 TaxID=1314779 RepID=A0A6A6E2J1_9PEZI|nr:hypothetical protein K469DRAFT_164723 [Zopfia rhizophila CBS 207.26]